MWWNARHLSLKTGLIEVLQRTICALLMLSGPLSSANAAIHRYNNEPFKDAGNEAYIFRGGREGLFASNAEVFA
jgi:hypothetical protein